ncbi:MAG: hypothetical protein ACYTEQ_28235, partial [Planctomycetota bacterium]
MSLKIARHSLLVLRPRQPLYPAHQILCEQPTTNNQTDPKFTAYQPFMRLEICVFTAGAAKICSILCPLLFSLELSVALIARHGIMALAMGKYPIFLEMGGRRAVVIGAGAVAVRKAQAL